MIIYTFDHEPDKYCGINFASFLRQKSIEQQQGYADYYSCVNIIIARF
jgi:hypothetical protein